MMITTIPLENYPALCTSAESDSLIVAHACENINCTYLMHAGVLPPIIVRT